MIVGEPRGDAATRGGNSNDDVLFFLREQRIGRCRDQHSAWTLVYDALDDANTPTRFSRHPRMVFGSRNKHPALHEYREDEWERERERERDRDRERERERNRDRIRPFELCCFDSPQIFTKYRSPSYHVTPSCPLFPLSPSHREGRRIRKLHLRWPPLQSRHRRYLY